jgi:hypothetical protein
MSDSTSTSGITPRFTPRGARELIDDIDLLLDHLGRALPGRLEACFDDSRGNTARSPAAADPPGVPGTPAGETVAADGRERRRSRAAFVQHLVGIAQRATPVPGEGGIGSPGGRDAEWQGFTTDLAFLIQARDFLATLVRPATVDTIRLTRAFVDETVRRRGKLLRSRRDRPFARAAGGDTLSPETPGRVLADGPGTPRNHAEIGVALAKRMHWYRWACFLSVVLTLLLSLYALTGKVLLEDHEQSQAFLASVAGDIAAAQAAEIQDARVADARSPGTRPAETAAATRVAQVAAAAIGGRNYCDQPFLDDEGVVQFASERQRELCERLWGVNEYQNRLNQQLYVWSAPFAHSPLGWPFGVTSFCTAPVSLDNGFGYAARLKVTSCQASRMSAGLRWPFFSISHSAL